MTSYITCGSYQIYIKSNIVKIVSEDCRTFQIELDNANEIFSNKDITFEESNNKLIVKTNSKNIYIPENIDDINIELIEINKLINKFKILEQENISLKSKIDNLENELLIIKNKVNVDASKIDNNIDIDNNDYKLNNNILYISDYSELKNISSYHYHVIYIDNTTINYFDSIQCYLSKFNNLQIINLEKLCIYGYAKILDIITDINKMFKINKDIQINVNTLHLYSVNDLYNIDLLLKYHLQCNELFLSDLNGFQIFNKKYITNVKRIKIIGNNYISESFINNTDLEELILMDNNILTKDDINSLLKIKNLKYFKMNNFNYKTIELFSKEEIINFVNSIFGIS